MECPEKRPSDEKTKTTASDEKTKTTARVSQADHALFSSRTDRVPDLSDPLTALRHCV